MGYIICHRYWRTGAPSSGLYLGHKGIFLRTVGMIYFVLPAEGAGTLCTADWRLAVAAALMFLVLKQQFTENSRIHPE